ncbi:putative ATP-grasp-modified RiPP [Pseudonocardia acaciae]|uniref:putative ATP-grasp-modified RiPP n=1 Tax=Pseudonocardia acaciae TaxID=551276 RepID=UPI0009FDB2C7
MRPFLLRVVDTAPERELPEFRYDPLSQMAVSPDGRPVAPDMKKEWTSYESTHTDGDGGDNETWGWEEVK